MECKEAREYMAVGPKEDARLPEHLVKCRECSNLWLEVYRTLEVKPEDISLPEGIHNRIMQAVEGQVKTRPVLLRQLYRAAAILVVSVLASLLASLFSGNEKAPGSRQAVDELAGFISPGPDTRDHYFEDYYQIKYK